MYKIGEMVVALPTEERATYVGEIEGVKKVTLFDTETGMSRELRYLINFYEFAEEDLISTGEKLVIDGAEVTLTNIGLVDGEYQLTFDNEFTILAERLYCDEDGLHIYNGESETVEESYDDDCNLAFMLGYLEAVEDATDYMYRNIYDKGECLWMKAIHSISDSGDMLHFMTCNRDKLTEFYNRVIELKNLADSDAKPELTLDEIKEKLGYDFNLVD